MITLSSRSTWATPRRGDAFGGAVLRSTVLGVISLFGTARYGPMVAIVLVVVVGAVAAYVDARTTRIPNQLVSLAVVVVVAGAVATTIDEGPTALVGPMWGVATFAGPLLACHVLSPSSIGFGDVKLAAVAGAALGLVDARLGLVALCVATGCTASLGLLRRRAELPLGPGLVVGAVVALLAPGTIWP